MGHAGDVTSPKQGNFECQNITKTENYNEVDEEMKTLEKTLIETTKETDWEIDIKLDEDDSDSEIEEDPLLITFYRNFVKEFYEKNKSKLTENSNKKKQWVN